MLQTSSAAASHKLDEEFKQQVAHRSLPGIVGWRSQRANLSTSHSGSYECHVFVRVTPPMIHVYHSHGAPVFLSHIARPVLHD